MMRASAAFLIVVTLAGSPLFGDAASSESQSVQSLLSEVRTLREELRIAIVTAQRLQIVLYRLQVQETTVSRAAQKLDEYRVQLARVEHSKKSVAGNVQRL